MSRLEETIKPLLLARIEQLDCPLDLDQTKALAEWMCVKAIVSEHEQGDSVLTPFEDRNALLQRSEIPGYFRIYVVAHSSTVRAAFMRHSATVSRTHAGPDPVLPPGINRNIQAITWLAGPLCFYVLAARVARFDLDSAFQFQAVTRLWPNPPEDVNLARLTVVSDHDLFSLSRAIESLLAQPDVVYGGAIPS